VLARLTPPLILAGLVLLFFAPLVMHPGSVLYSDWSDVLAEHLPAKRFLVESWRETGELPLWCPYSFGGAPFIHDIQVGIFYPPNFLLYLLPVEYVGAGMSWLVVAHLIVASWCAYGYARSHGMGRAGAFVTGMGFAFAGRWLLHILAAGHTITLGLAWFPLVLLCMERAISRRSLAWATGAGASFALIVLGTQPQWTLYAGVLLAFWTLGTALEEAGYLEGGDTKSARRTAVALARWFGYGAWAAFLAAALAAVQLLPTLEAARYSTRSAGVEPGDVLAGGMRTLLFLIGPAVTDEPFNLRWEDRGGFTLLWLAAAVFAAWYGGKRLRFQGGVCALLFLFAMGGALAVQWLPGFRLFRQTPRMLIVAAFPVAYLAGWGVERLLRACRDATDSSTIARYRSILLRIGVMMVICTGGFAIRLIAQGQNLRGHVYWLSLLITVPAVIGLLRTRSAFSQMFNVIALVAIFLMDLWALTWPLVDVRKESEIYAPSPSVSWLSHEAKGRLLDRDADDDVSSPLGRGAPLAMLNRLESIRGYNPLDNRRFKEYLQLISGEEDSLRPFEGPLAYPVIGNFPIRNKRLLDLLGVRYLLQPSAWPLEQTGWRQILNDPAPVAYDFVAGGRQPLPAYTLYENPETFPHASFVPHAHRFDSAADLLTADFHREVLVEEDAPQASGDWEDSDYGSAVIRDYRPNCVIVDVGTTAKGWLLLTDVYYPGWTCQVDGVTRKVYRGDYLFRAVQLDAGRHEVVFRFEPQSYRWGKWISLAALALLASMVPIYSACFRNRKCC
jgi:hypothetical protein